MVFSLGIHTFDLSSLVLTNAGNKKQIYLGDCGLLRFLYELNVDFSKDEILLLCLDQSGVFRRLDTLIETHSSIDAICF